MSFQDELSFGGLSTIAAVICDDFSIMAKINPIQTGLFWTFWDRGGSLEAPLCISKTINAMATKFSQNSIQVNSDLDRNFDDTVT